jgi:hypothetical protein
MLFHCSNTNTDSPLSSNRVKVTKKHFRNFSFHSIVFSLVIKFKDLKPTNQRNIPEDHYPESRHCYQYSQYLLLHVHLVYCQSGKRGTF